MSKTKRKTSKDTEPDVSLMIAQLGEFAEGGQFRAEFILAFYWRWRTLLCDFVKRGRNSEKGEEDDRKLKEQIGDVVRAAVVQGDTAFLQRLAVATDFVNHSLRWDADNLTELSQLLAWKETAFTDPLRATIAFEYYQRNRGAAAEEKKAKSTFMPHVAAKLGRVAEKAFERTFHKACKELGIQWLRRASGSPDEAGTPVRGKAAKGVKPMKKPKSPSEEKPQQTLNRGRKRKGTLIQGALPLDEEADSTRGLRNGDVDALSEPGSFLTRVAASESDLPGMTTTAHDIASVLNSLIETCKDGQEGFRSAADNVKNADMAALFQSYSTQRQQFVTELQTLVRGLGEGMEKSGSVAGALHRGWIDLKAAVSAKDEHAILSECERGEDSAVEQYREALEHSGIPADVHSVIQRQYSSVQEAHDRVRDLRDAYKK